MQKIRETNERSLRYLKKDTHTHRRTDGRTHKQGQTRGPKSTVRSSFSQNLLAIDWTVIVWDWAGSFPLVATHLYCPSDKSLKNGNRFTDAPVPSEKFVHRGCLGILPETNLFPLKNQSNWNGWSLSTKQTKRPSPLSFSATKCSALGHTLKRKYPKQKSTKSSILELDKLSSLTF